MPVSRADHELNRFIRKCCCVRSISLNFAVIRAADWLRGLHPDQAPRGRLSRTNLRVGRATIDQLSNSSEHLANRADRVSKLRSKSNGR